jgi:hypothetical protein
MEPLEAIRFAVNIMQFVDSICHALDIGSQIRRSGIRESPLDLEESIKLLDHHSSIIQSQVGVVTGFDAADQVGRSTIRVYTC